MVSHVQYEPPEWRKVREKKPLAQEVHQKSDISEDISE